MDAVSSAVEAGSAPSEGSSSGCQLSGDDEALFRFEDRSYRVQGLKKALVHGSLHVSVLAQRDGDFFAPPSPVSGWFLDRFDFVSARQRSLFEKQAAQDTGHPDHGG